MMKKENKKQITDKRFSISIILALVMFMISGSITAAAMTNSYGQTSQVLPICTDPTGHNLQCIVFISTLPPPTNTKLCQETSGQIFKCNYIVETLKNGLQIVVITVYVPNNYVVTGSENFQVLKVKVTVTENRSEHDSCPDGLILHGGWCFLKLDCPPGSNQVFFGDLSWCSWPPTCPDSQHWNSTTMECQKPTPPTPPPLMPTINTTTATNMSQTQPKTNVTGNLSAPTTPAASVPPPLSNNTNNTSGHHPSKTKSGSNLTQSSVTPPPVSVPPIPPTSKTCPDGSVIDASANCPTQSTPPPNPKTPSTPPLSDNNPSPPSSNDNGNNNPPSSGNGNSDKGGGGSDKGSNTPQPSTFS